MPFLDRMGWVFVICVGLMVVISLLDPKSKNNKDTLDVHPSMFQTHRGFTIGALIITGILAALYLVLEQKG